MPHARPAHLPAFEKHSAPEEFRIAEALIQSEARIARTFVHSAEAIDALRQVAFDISVGKLRLRDALRDGDVPRSSLPRARSELVDTLRGVAAKASELDEPSSRALLEEDLVQVRLHRRVLDRISNAIPVGHPTAAIARGALARADRYKSQLVTANLHVAVGSARRFRRAAVDVADMVQEATIGLMRACDKFDPSRGHRFGAYAGFWVRQQILRGLVEHDGTIRIPLEVAAARHRASRTHRRFAAAHGRAPTRTELAVSSGLGLKVVEVLRALPGEPVSLNATVDDGDAELIAKLVDHRVPRADRQIDSERSRARIHTLLHALPPREAAILTLRFGLEGEEELTLREVGERLNLSREHVRRIEERALAKLAPLLRATGSEESPD